MSVDGNFNAFKTKPAHLPFRPFFLAAAVDAMLGAGGWLPSALGTQAAISAGDWHRDLLVFGMVPAVLTGFLLTALPRWTGRQAVLPRTTYLLIVLWACGRLAFLLLPPSFGLVCSAVWILALLLIAARVVIAGRDRRNLKTLLLLAGFCGSNVLVAVSYQVEFGLRLALASIIGLEARYRYRQQEQSHPIAGSQGPLEAVLEISFEPSALPMHPDHHLQYEQGGERGHADLKIVRPLSVEQALQEQDNPGQQKGSAQPRGDAGPQEDRAVAALAPV